MVKTILVPTDGSDLSSKAIDAAVEMAHVVGAKIAGICVTEPYPFSPLAESAIAVDAGSYEEKQREIAQTHLDKIKRAAEARQVPCETMIAISFSPSGEIIKTANNRHCDAIVMASHGRKGLSKLFVGSETQKVLANSKLPVMVFR